MRISSASKAAVRPTVRGPLSGGSVLGIPGDPSALWLIKNGVLQPESIGKSIGPVQPGQSLYFEGAQLISVPFISLPGAFEIEWYQSADNAKSVGLPPVFGYSLDNDYIGFNNAASYRLTLSIVGGSTIYWVGVDTSAKHYKLVRDASNNVVLTVDGVAKSPQVATGTLDINQIGKSRFSNYFGGHLWGLSVKGANGGTLLSIPGAKGLTTAVPAFPKFGTVSGVATNFFAEHFDGLTGLDPNILGFTAATDGKIFPKSTHLSGVERNGNDYLQQLNSVSNFDASGVWVDGAAEPLVPVTTHYENGSGAILLETAEQDVAVSASANIAARFDSTDIWVLRGYLEGVTDVNVRVTFSNGAATAVFTTDETAESWGNNGVVWLDIESANLVLTGWTLGSTTATNIKIEAWGAPGVKFWLDIIARNPKARTKIAFTFDDINDSDYYAYQYLATKGFKGASFVISSYVDRLDIFKLTLAQMTEMYAAGWDFGNHTTDHSDLTLLDLAAQTAKISGCSAWLNTNGFTRASDCVAYPFGKRNADTVSALASLNILAGRTTYTKYQETATGTENPYEHSVRVSVGSSTSLAAAKTLIDNAVTRGVSAVVLIHRLVDSAPGTYEWSKSDFEALVDYIKAYSDNGRLDVMQYRDWVVGRSAAAITEYDITGGTLQHPGPIKLSIQGPADACYWPSAPRILLRTGVDNAVYNADGTGKTFASHALALAAMATVADDEYLFAGTKEAVLYLTSQLANAARIKRAVGDAT